jgi:hypothetical protein
MAQAIMKIIATLLFVLGFAVAQNEDHSGLKSSQAKAIVASFENKKLSKEDLIPNGFTMVAEAKADLNQDGIDDLALVIREKPKSESRDDQYLSQAVLLFLGDKAGTFRLWKIGPHHMMDSNSELIMDGGIGTFEIKKGVLTILSSTAVSMGTWFNGVCTQKWRNEKSGFRLIGLTIDNMDRKCGCGETRDTNFLTGEEIFTDDKNADGRQASKRKTKKIRGNPRVILWDDFDYDTFCTFGP